MAADDQLTFRSMAQTHGTNNGHLLLIAFTGYMTTGVGASHCLIKDIQLKGINIIECPSCSNYTSILFSSSQRKMKDLLLSLGTVESCLDDLWHTAKTANSTVHIVRSCYMKVLFVQRRIKPTLIQHWMCGLELSHSMKRTGLGTMAIPIL